MSRLPVLLVAGVLGLGAPAPAQAADPEVARLTAEVARLQQDLRDLRQLVMTMAQSDQQRYDLLLQMMKAQGNGQGANPPAVASSAAPARAAAGTESAATRRSTGTISGKVDLGAGASEVYVYVDGLRGVGLRARTVEIKQKDKQFSPQVVAVPLGSKLIFPNVDTVFHNVFSPTPGQAFDTGSIKGGETSRPVTASRPGHLEIFCNIHRKMRADILVVPNGHYTKVRGDGTFELEGVPAGVHKVVLWGPGIKTTSQAVEVSGKGASVQFAAVAAGNRPHLNKVGQPYGSYDD
ncbi:MAG TPA: cupredoxin domain-containing protein [Polyangia bacterium]